MKKLTWYQRLWEYGVNRRTPQSEILSVLSNASVQCRNYIGVVMDRRRLEMATHQHAQSVNIQVNSIHGALSLSFNCDLEVAYERIDDKDERNPKLLAFTFNHGIGNAMYNGRHWKQEINHQIQEIIENKITKL